MVGVKKDQDGSMVSEIIYKVKVLGANRRKKIKLAPAYCESLDYIVRHEAVQKMRVGPSESACRSGLQTT